MTTVFSAALPDTPTRSSLGLGRHPLGRCRDTVREAAFMGAGHDHGHSHGGPPPTGGTAAAAYKGRLRIALGITLTVLLAEIVGSVLTGSLALLADAGHMATDAVGGCRWRWWPSTSPTGRSAAGAPTATPVRRSWRRC
ncbi:hypothetical protein GCM10020000_14550 [Streptomyces olivoverticillatus]